MLHYTEQTPQIRCYPNEDGFPIYSPCPLREFFLHHHRHRPTHYGYLHLLDKYRITRPYRFMRRCFATLYLLKKRRTSKNMARIKAKVASKVKRRVKCKRNIIDTKQHLVTLNDALQLWTMKTLNTATETLIDNDDLMSRRVMLGVRGGHVYRLLWVLGNGVCVNLIKKKVLK